MERLTPAGVPIHDCDAFGWRMQNGMLQSPSYIAQRGYACGYRDGSRSGGGGGGQSDQGWQRALSGSTMPRMPSVSEANTALKTVWTKLGGTVAPCLVAALSFGAGVDTALLGKLNEESNVVVRVELPDVAAATNALWARTYEMAETLYEAGLALDSGKRDKDDLAVYRKAKDCWTWTDNPDVEGATTNAPADFLAYANSPGSKPIYYNRSWWGVEQYWPNGRRKYAQSDIPPGGTGTETNLNFGVDAYAEDGVTKLFRFGVNARRDDPTDGTLVAWGDAPGTNPFVRLATTDSVARGLDGARDHADAAADGALRAAKEYADSKGGGADTNAVVDIARDLLAKTNATDISSDFATNSIVGRIANDSVGFDVRGDTLVLVDGTNDVWSCAGGVTVETDPVWNEQKAAYQPKLVSGTNIKTVNGNSLLGSGDIEIQGGGGVTPEQVRAIAGSLVSSAAQSGTNYTDAATAAKRDLTDLEVRERVKPEYLPISGGGFDWSSHRLEVFADMVQLYDAAEREAAEFYLDGGMLSLADPGVSFNGREAQTLIGVAIIDLPDTLALKSEVGALDARLSSKRDLTDLDVPARMKPEFLPVAGGAHDWSSYRLTFNAAQNYYFLLDAKGYAGGVFAAGGKLYSYSTGVTFAGRSASTLLGTAILDLPDTLALESEFSDHQIVRGELTTPASGDPYWDLLVSEAKLAQQAEGLAAGFWYDPSKHPTTLSGYGITNGATKAEIPTALPNPNALTITGATNVVYDGSTAKTVNIPDTSDFVPFVTDKVGSKTAVTIGTRVAGASSIGSRSLTVGSACAALADSLAVGIYAYANQNYTIALGYSPNVTHELAFTWNGIRGSSYNSKGNGTFAINPAGGTAGFYIGGESLAELLAVARPVRRYAMFIIPMNDTAYPSGAGHYTQFELKASTNNFSASVPPEDRLLFYSHSAFADIWHDGKDRMHLFLNRAGGDDRSYTRIPNTLDGMPGYAPSAIVVLVDASLMNADRSDGGWLRDDNEGVIWTWVRTKDSTRETDPVTGRPLWNPIAPVRWFSELPPWAR